MKVLFLLTYYHPYWTGLTQYAKRMAEEMVKRKAEVEVLAVRHDKSLKGEDEIAGVRVTRKDPWFRISRTLISPALLITMVPVIKRSDKVVVFLPLAETFYAALLCKLFNKPLILVHNGDLVLPRGRGNKLLESIYLESTKFALSVCRKVVVLTEDYSKSSRLLSAYKNKWRVIPLAVAPMKKSLETKRVIINLIGRKSYPVVGFAGRFVEEKGFDILLKAIPEIIRVYPQAVFVFAGDTHLPYENFYNENLNLINAYRNLIIETGLLPLNKMGGFYAVCDVFVISSRTDCFPSTQVEAMKCGVPVVCTNIPGARWAIQATGMGEIVKTESPTDLADGIIKVVGNSKKYKANKYKVEEIFSYRRSMDQYAETIFNS